MKFPVAAAAVLLALVVASCAKRETEDTTILEQKSLDAWVETNRVKSGVAVARQSNGVWIEFLEDGDPEAAPVSDTTVWVNLYYTSTDVAGNVFATRDSTEALRQRTFSPHTYYVPDYRYCGEPEYTNRITRGVYQALRDELVRADGSKTKLRKGSRVKLYMPSFMAYGGYGTSNDQGFGGQYALGNNRIVIEDITIRDVIRNPLSHEEETVERFARDRWGKGRADTLAKGFYIDTVNFRPADLLAEFPQRDYDARYRMTADSTARVWYVGRFLPTPEYPDGFIFDTNIASVYEGFFGRRRNQNYPPQAKTMEALSYNIIGKDEKDDNGKIGAWGEVMPKLRRGQWCRMIFTSSYGYGYLGYSKDLLQQQLQLENYYAQVSYYSMYGGYGGGYGGYGGGYGYGSGYGYDPYGYTNMLMNQQSSSQIKGVITEVQPYTPLMFDIYVEYPYEE